MRMSRNSPSTPPVSASVAPTRRLRSGDGTNGSSSLNQRAIDAWLIPPRALIEGLLDAVWLVDPQSLRIVAANAACGGLLHVDAASLCGQDMLSMAATPEDMAFWQEAALGWADSVESHSWVRRADGELVAVLRRVSRVMLSADKALFMVVMHDHSSERRVEDELSDRLAELSATLESTHDGILVTDTSGRIRNFNQRFAALWDLPDSLLVQRDDDAILSWMLRRSGRHRVSTC